jgi:hypothetical protein
VAVSRSAWGRVVAVVAVAALLLGGAGCGDDSDDGLPQPTDTPSPTPIVDPLEAEVLAALDVYMDAVIAAKTDPDPSGAGLEPLIETPHVNVIIGQIQLDMREGRQFQGNIYVVWAELFEDNLDDPVPHVVVRTCMDASDFLLVDIDTGELAGVDPKEHQPKHEVRIWFHPHEDGGWEAGAAQWPRWFRGVPEEHAPQC